MRTRHLASLSLALTLGAATVAAAQSTTTPAEPAPGQTVGAPAGAAASTETGPQTPHRHRRDDHSRLFRGVHLTADERGKLATIREQYRTQLKPLFHQIRTARHAIRTAAARADTAAVSTARATLRDARGKFRAVRSQWVSDVRGVLTPDQQAQFDKNVARMQSRDGARANRKS